MRIRVNVHYIWMVLISLLVFVDSALSADLSARPLINQKIDASKQITLPDGIQSEVFAANDRGRISDDFLLDHILLMLKRSPEREVALAKFIEEQHDKNSPNYHRWLTAQEFGDRFGSASSDLIEVTNWLKKNGFVVNKLYQNGVMIDFSGSAGQVRKYLGGEIHSLEMNGDEHYANINNFKVPIALSQVIMSIAPIGDFRAKSLNRQKLAPAFTYPNSDHAVSPADIAAIYNLNSLFQSGNTGQGVVVATINYANPKDTNDWTLFRSTFGLSQYPGNVSLVHPGGCADPGPGTSYDDEVESVMDPEMVMITAPGATILAATCKSNSADPLLVTLLGLINQNSPPSIISLSYIQQEHQTTFLSGFIAAYQQAVAQGISIFVASGDRGGRGTNASNTVNGLASTPYSVAVGGTQLYGTFAPDGTVSSIWNGSNLNGYQSAQSYISELPWNVNCANQIVANYKGFATVYGSGGYCNRSGNSDWSFNSVSGGGPSTCGVRTDSGNCAGWNKPAWQANVPGIPNDGVRGTPDVALVAQSIFLCDSGNYSPPCGNLPNYPLQGAGGTSASSPLMAGIQALVNQKTLANWGNPASIYYQIAGAQYQGLGAGACNSNSTSSPSSACVFYDITRGDTDFPCASGVSGCFFGSPPSGTIGVMSLSASSYSPAWPATVGWDFATGLGSVNAGNLIGAWPKSPVRPSVSAAAIMSVLDDECDSSSDSACSE